MTDAALLLAHPTWTEADLAATHQDVLDFMARLSERVSSDG